MFWVALVAVIGGLALAWLGSNYAEPPDDERGVLANQIIAAGLGSMFCGVVGLLIWVISSSDRW